MFIYFLIWQVLFVLGWNLRFILKLIMGEDVFIENFILDKIISVAVRGILKRTCNYP